LAEVQKTNNMGRRRSKRSSGSGNTPAPQAARAAGKTTFAGNMRKAIAARTGKQTQAQQAAARPTVAQRPKIGSFMGVPVGRSTPTAAAAVGAKALKDFQMANPNAPKMPTGIGVMGAPANKPQQMNMAGGKGGMRPTPRPQQPMGGGFGKGGQRPAPRPNIEMTNSGVPGAGTQPRPQRPGGKGAVQAAGGAISGKGGQRPSPSMGRPNFGAMPQNQAGIKLAQPAASVSAADAIDQVPAASVMMKKAPVFKMRSAHNTTFKEMGSGNNKKSTPTTRKARGGYSMPGFGNR